jgi:hypothetical protein
VTQAKRPTVMILETLDYLRPTTSRVAVAFSKADIAHVLVCHWRSLEFAAGRVTARGRMYRPKTNGVMEEADSSHSVPIDALYFFAPKAGSITARDIAALEQMRKSGVPVHEGPIHLIVEQIMVEASRRGVVSNTFGTDRSWGAKHSQELRIRRYEQATGRSIARPETHIATQAELAGVLADFSRRQVTCIAKPAFGEGGRGIQIMRPGEDFTWQSTNQIVIVQQLIQEPLLVDAHKTDLRCYLLIDERDARVSRRLKPVLARKAAAPYSAGLLASEITNTSYRLSQGLPPDIVPLGNLCGCPEEIRAAIISGLDTLCRQIAEAYFFDIASLIKPTESPSNRVVLLGVDVLVALSNHRPCLYFLEANPYPALFRDSPLSDSAVDHMLTEEYLPALLRNPVSLQCSACGNALICEISDPESADRPGWAGHEYTAGRYRDRRKDRTSCMHYPHQTAVIKSQSQYSSIGASHRHDTLAAPNGTSNYPPVDRVHPTD